MLWFLILKIAQLMVGLQLRFRNKTCIPPGQISYKTIFPFLFSYLFLKLSTEVLLIICLFCLFSIPCFILCCAWLKLYFFTSCLLLLFFVSLHCSLLDDCYFSGMYKLIGKRGGILYRYCRPWCDFYSLVLMMDAVIAVVYLCHWMLVLDK